MESDNDHDRGFFVERLELEISLRGRSIIAMVNKSHGKTVGASIATTTTNEGFGLARLGATVSLAVG
jgi:hypothetical protein